MRTLRVAVSACLLAGALALGGCRGGSDDPATSGGVESRPAPPASAFPAAEGKTLAEVIDEASGPAELVVSPAAMTFYKGENRYSFGVFEKDRTQVPDADVALYFAKVPSVPSAPGEIDPEASEESRAQALDQPAVGPFPAAVESLETQGAFRALTTSNDPDAALAVYTTEINFPSEGEWRIAALIEDDGELTGTLLPSAVVGRFDVIPTVGDQAPPIHTPTAEDVGGRLEQITTRVPPDTQNEVDFADVVGREPAVLLFATPQFCQSRTCGPVVDVAEQVKEQYGEEAAFIHMEIFKDNDPNKGVRPQVRAFNLPSEPWLFVVDANGTIRTALEGAFSVDELTRAVEEVTG